MDCKTIIFHMLFTKKPPPEGRILNQFLIQIFMTKTQILFKHMHDEHNLILLDGELWEIIRIVKECLEEEYGSMETKIVNP